MIWLRLGIYNNQQCCFDIYGLYGAGLYACKVDSVASRGNLLNQIGTSFLEMGRAFYMILEIVNGGKFLAAEYAVG